MKAEHKERMVLSGLIYNTNNQLKSLAQETLRDFKLTGEQWVVLGKLYKCSGELNQKEIAGETKKDQASITRMIDRFEKRGLAERRKSPSDRREYIVHITEEGRALYEKTLGPMHDEEAFVNSLLPEKEREQLEELLQIFLERLTEKNQ